jgi:hypothetical protein
MKIGVSLRGVTRNGGEQTLQPLWRSRAISVLTLTTLALAAHMARGEKPSATRHFEVRAERPFLDGQPIDLWGVRCGNALMSDTVTQRHIHCLDEYIAHGVNCIGVYIQGSNPGWPDLTAGRNGFTPDGTLRPEFARRLESLIRAADQRGMVVMVGLISPRKDQELKDVAAVQRAVEETAKFLTRRKLRNVFVDLVHEYNSSRITDRLDHDILHEPDGARKKAMLTAWFKKYAPEIPVGVCPSFPTSTANTYPGMDVRIIQKAAEIPESGFVVNVEMQREDIYDNDGVFSPEARERMLATFERYRSRPNAFLMFHCAYCQGITDKSGTGPNPEIGGLGIGPEDRGMRIYFDWVKEHIGSYQYPKHSKGRGQE